MFSGFKNKSYCLTLASIFLSFFAFSQCEDLKGNQEVNADWQAEYFRYFNLDFSANAIIKADSVLIYYLSNSDNETNYAMPCCYFLAEHFAQTELKENLTILYAKLEKEDSANLYNAQKAWQNFYDTEWTFIKTAFVGYANVSKYGQGREIMIEDASREYGMIKDRILTIKEYIEMVTTQ
jgi:uncharacterized protein YecT (DUF1311 family)